MSHTAGSWFASKQKLPWLEKLIETIKPLTEGDDNSGSNVPNIKGPTGAVLSFLWLIEVSTHLGIPRH
jgi:hypothetical protein